MPNFGYENMHFEWTYPWVFTFVIIVPLVYWILPPMRKKTAALVFPSFSRAVQVSGINPRKKSKVSKKSVFQWFTLFLIYIGILVGAAGPKLVGQPEKKIKTARSFLITADMSFSMDNKDWVVEKQRLTRWHAVQKLMTEFIKGRKSDRMGLVLFATHPYLQAPLTEDLHSVMFMLNDAEVGMAGQMTGIGDAIGYSMKVFEQDTTKEKVILLLTDGVDSGRGTNPLDAAAVAKNDSIKIYTLGIGDPTGRDKIDEKTMTYIAESTGGQYFRAMDEKELKKAYKALDDLEPIKYETSTLKPEVLLYFYPIAVSIALSFLLIFYLNVVSLLKSNTNG
ncbi:VWA domain-containing protein [Flammeovirga sp. SubArs3]|uniref:VWA domain-containing protein n=1 Tax=Flammeovirga sp. SubArs3 TaxID=2995316 RepID=UPI00248B1654|nr:VWA domain-containing protein [Flammeovirga sp. SubArs3]